MPPLPGAPCHSCSAARPQRPALKASAAADQLQRREAARQRSRRGGQRLRGHYSSLLLQVRRCCFCCCARAPAAQSGPLRLRGCTGARAVQRLQQQRLRGRAGGCGRQRRAGLLEEQRVRPI
jgi:hypothetical protein